MPRREPSRTLILGLLCMASFSVVFNNLIITPILPSIASDLDVRITIAGLLVTGYAIASGAAGIFSGPLIDKLGRKPIVVWGMTLLAVATALSALAPGYYWLMASRILAGLGVACLTPAVFAAVGDYFAYNQRGRAMSWVVTANTSASIFGVPAGAFIAGVASWRLTFCLLAMLSFVFAWLLFRNLPSHARSEEQTTTLLHTLWQVVSSVPTLMAILAGFLGTTYWFLIMTYIGAYFFQVYGVAAWALGAVTLVMGTGVLIGSNLGGRIGDRIGNKPVIMVAAGSGGAIMALETTVIDILPLAAALLFLYAVGGGARFACHQTLMTEMLPRFRGTVMALNASGQQFGIVAGSALGAFVLAQWGYTGLGPATGAIAVLAVLNYALFVDESSARSAGDARAGPGVEEVKEP